MKQFTVVDLSPQCEIRSQSTYEYELLEQLQGAANLIGLFSSRIWSSPEEFEVPQILSPPLGTRWCASGEGVGLLTVFDSHRTLSLSVVASGINLEAERITFEAFHNHILRELHDTGIEPAFDLLGLQPRPLVATVGIFAPEGADAQWIFALADRCFGAAYFRKLHLA